MELTSSLAFKKYRHRPSFRKAIEDHWTRYKYITDTNIPIPLSSDL